MFSFVTISNGVFFGVQTPVQKTASKPGKKSANTGTFGSASEGVAAVNANARSLPALHMALGYLAFTNRETGEALHHFQTALDLNPNFAAAYGYVGLALQHDGQSDQAIGYFNQAIRMSPRDPLNAFFFGGIAGAHYFACRYTDAVKWARQAVQSRHSIWAGHRMLCASLAQAGQIEEAKLVLAQLRQLQPNLSIRWVRQSIPWTAGPMEKVLEGLCKAGLTD